MTNSLPGFDEPGIFENQETHLAPNKYSEGYVVRYWNETLCMAQTALYNDDALDYLQHLIKVVTPHRLMQSCLALDVYPSEYLHLRKIIPLEDWSLVIAQSRPEVVAVCFAHLLHPELYREWIMMVPDFNSYDRTTDPFMYQLYGDICEHINQKVEGFAKELVPELKVGLGLDELAQMSPHKALYLAEHGQLDLTAIFKLCQSPAIDACTFLMARMNTYQLGMLHMATFNPKELETMKGRLGPIIKPEKGVDLDALDRQMKTTAAFLTSYTDHVLHELLVKKETEPLAETFTNDEFNALFGLK